MYYDVHVFDRATYHFFFANITVENLHVCLNGGEVCFLSRGEIVQNANGVAVPQQFFAHV